jgi:plasmid stabilization system protein ParE
LLSIREYIVERNPMAAARIGARIRESAELLRYFPGAGHHGRVAATKEWVVQGTFYVLVYEINESGEVMILGVFHAAQDRDDPDTMR